VASHGRGVVMERRRKPDTAAAMQRSISAPFMTLVSRKAIQ
jgi:hypothetical protein